MSNPYDDKFFKQHLKKKKILEDYAERIHLLYNPASVVDVGCGPAHALNHFRGKGCAVKGLEFSIGPAKAAAVPSMREYMESCDVSKWLDDWSYGRYDIAISWHMAEHVPKSFAETIVEGLTRLSDVIHFSAAPPGQKGVGHVNCQTPEWWGEIFDKYGYDLDQMKTDEWYEPMRRKYGENKYGRGIRDNARIFVKHT